MTRSKTPTEERVSEAALAILNKSGYGALSLTSVANHLKLSKQRIYYHFTTPDDLVLQLAKKWAESGQYHTLNALANTKEESFLRVKAMAIGMFDWIEANPELARLGLELHQIAPQIKKVGSYIEAVRLGGRSRIKSLLVLDKRFANKKDSELEEITTALHSHMYGFYFYLVAMNQLDNIGAARENCINALHSMLLAYAKSD